MTADGADQVEGKPVPIYVLIQTHSKQRGETAFLPQRPCSRRVSGAREEVEEVVLVERLRGASWMMAALWQRLRRPKTGIWSGRNEDRAMKLWDTVGRSMR